MWHNSLISLKYTINMLQVWGLILWWEQSEWIIKARWLLWGVKEETETRVIYKREKEDWCLTVTCNLEWSKKSDGHRKILGLKCSVEEVGPTCHTSQWASEKGWYIIKLDMWWKVYENKCLYPMLKKLYCDLSPEFVLSVRGATINYYQRDTDWR